jgi:pyrroloquinoline quinone biosynthesis protein D
VTDTRIPRFPPGVRLRHDAVRNAWVVLAPERLFMPDEHALAVLQRVDGARTIDDIVTDLAAAYAAPRAEIATDVIALLADLAARGALRL